MRGKLEVADFADAITAAVTRPTTRSTCLGENFLLRLNPGIVILLCTRALRGYPAENSVKSVTFECSKKVDKPSLLIPSSRTHRGLR